MKRTILELFLVGLILLLSSASSACLSAYPAPMAQAPLFTKQGEAELGVGLRVLAPRRGALAAIRVAATDHLRIGALASGAFMWHSKDWFGDLNGPHHVKRYFAANGEAFVGGEGAHRTWRFGGLAAGGYGVSQRTIKRCLVHFKDQDEGNGGPLSNPTCQSAHLDRKSSRYVRTYGQLHLGLAPSRHWRGAVGLRVPLIHDFEHARDHLLVYPEAFVSNSVLLQRVRFELQLLAGAPDQRFTIQFAVFPRIGGS